MAANHMPGRLVSQQGFTLVELLVSFFIVAALAAMGMMYMADVRKRSGDAVAISEGRNLMNVVSQAVLQREDVDLNHAFSGGNKIGADPDNPIYTLPDRVRAEITVLDDLSTGDSYNLEIRIWHAEGSDGTALSLDGRREFVFTIDEASGTVEIPSW